MNKQFQSGSFRPQRSHVTIIGFDTTGGYRPRQERDHRGSVFGGVHSRMKDELSVRIDQTMQLHSAEIGMAQSEDEAVKIICRPILNDTKFMVGKKSSTVRQAVRGAYKLALINQRFSTPAGTPVEVPALVAV